MKKVYILFLALMLLSWSASSQLDSITNVRLTFTPAAGDAIVATATDSGSGLIADGAITLTGNSGTNSAWVITDDQGNILIAGNWNKIIDILKRDGYFASLNIPRLKNWRTCARIFDNKVLVMYYNEPLQVF